jgi:hypothetical protein
MSERIKELVRESTTDSSGKWLSLEDAERLAELIVKECIEVIVRNEHASLNVSNFTDDKAQGIQLGLEFATIDIAEHFGVEE